MSVKPAPAGAVPCPEAPRRPRATSRELRSAVASHRLDDLAHAIDVALPSALDLEHPTGSQRPGQPRPQAIVIGHPVQRGRREDRVHGLVQVEVQCVLAPHLGAVAEPVASERDHVRRGVKGQHSASWHERQQSLCHPPGAASDVEHRCVRRDALQPREHLRGPGLLRLARAVIGACVPGGARHGARLSAQRVPMPSTSQVRREGFGQPRPVASAQPRKRPHRKRLGERFA